MKNLQDCLTIVNNSKHFIKKTNTIDGFEIISFDYNDGAKFKDFEEHDAFELRGLTFVGDSCFPMLHKFFNLGEKYIDEVKDSLSKNIKSIQVKDDGSLIGFILLPNDRVVPKTKTGFSNPYTDIAYKWLSSDDNENKIRNLLKRDIHPLFECVSPNFKIVLSYDWEGLKFIQARNSSGEYFQIESLSQIAQENNFVFEEPLDLSLEELLSLKDTISDIEGFIVRFDDDSFTKVKTSWYFKEHASDEGLIRVNDIISSYLNGKNIAEEDFEVSFIKEVDKKVLKPFSINSIEELKAFVFRDGDPKDVSVYQQLFKSFLKEYSLLNNYDNENTLIRLTVDNRLDDILPQLTDSQRVKAENIQDIVIDYLDTNVDTIISILEKGLSHKDINLEYGSFEFKGVALRYNGRDWNQEDILEFVKNGLLKKTKKLLSARQFVNKIKDV
jgi:T4 RnlA family RNA ligase